jgi:hypothetical protein
VLAVSAPQLHRVSVRSDATRPASASCSSGSCPREPRLPARRQLIRELHIAAPSRAYRSQFRPSELQRATHGSS